MPILDNITFNKLMKRIKDDMENSWNQTMTTYQGNQTHITSSVPISDFAPNLQDDILPSIFNTTITMENNLEPIEPIVHELGKSPWTPPIADKSSNKRFLDKDAKGL